MNANLIAGAALGLAALLVWSGGFAMGAPPPPLIVTQADEGKTFALTKNECLRVQLSSQPSTGYGWEQAADSTPLLKFKSTSIINPATMPGGVETEELIFCATGTGHGTLKLQYRRSWEKDVPALKSFAISVTIGP